MALKPTIFKIKVSLSDLNRGVYDTFSLTIAQHPSETSERMMARFLAYCLNFADGLELCKGLSDTEEPDLWARSLSGEIDCWIEIGEPSVDRVKKATRQARNTLVYCFNSKAETWWQQESGKLEKLPVAVFQIPWSEIKLLAEMVERTMDVSVTISGNSVYVATAKGEVELSLSSLHQPDE